MRNIWRQLTTTNQIYHWPLSIIYFCVFFRAFGLCVWLSHHILTFFFFCVFFFLSYKNIFICEWYDALQKFWMHSECSLDEFVWLKTIDCDPILTICIWEESIIKRAFCLLLYCLWCRCSCGLCIKRKCPWAFNQNDNSVVLSVRAYVCFCPQKKRYMSCYFNGHDSWENAKHQKQQRNNISHSSFWLAKRILTTFFFGFVR